MAGASWKRTLNKVGTHNAYASQLTFERVLTHSGMRKPMVCSLSSLGMEFHEQAAMFGECETWGWKNGQVSGT